MTDNEDKKDNVIDIRDVKHAKKLSENPYIEDKDAVEIFKEALERYKKQKQKLAEERKKDNERTKRSYRLNRRKDD
jgi:hypothetical protein